MSVNSLARRRPVGRHGPCSRMLPSDGTAYGRPLLARGLGAIPDAGNGLSMLRLPLTPTLRPLLLSCRSVSAHSEDLLLRKSLLVQEAQPRILQVGTSAELQLRVVKRWRWRRRPPASAPVRTAQRFEPNRALRRRSAVLRPWSACVNARLALFWCHFGPIVCVQTVPIPS